MSNAMTAPADPKSLVDGSSNEALVLRRASNELNSELTPGLIHEVNNVLTGIYFNLEACQEASGSDGGIPEAILEIGRGVERIKELLARATQIHLNVAERETTYHDLEALVASELDLLRVVFPRTAKIEFCPPSAPIHVRVAEYPFRIALLSAAARLRAFLPTGRIGITVSIFTNPQLEEVAARLGKEIPPGSVGVSFRIPSSIDSAREIDAYPAMGASVDVSMANAEAILAELGGCLAVWNDSATEDCLVLLVLPCCDF
jgi:hypothetical protein